MVNSKVTAKFVEHIYSKLREQVSGNTTERTIGDKPQQKFFVGTLCNLSPNSPLGEIRTKVAPVRMGVEFLLKKEDADKVILQIHPQLSVFYKVTPTYEEQLHAAMQQNKLDCKNIMALISTQAALAKKGEEQLVLGPKLLNVFKKHTIPPTIITASLPTDAGEGEKELEEPKNILEQIQEAYRNDPTAHRSKRTKKEEMNARIPLSALTSKEEYSSFMAAWGEKDIKPEWSFKIILKKSAFENNLVKVSVIIDNDCQAQENDYIDHFLFDVELKVNVEGAKIEEFVLDYLNDYYKYNGEMGAIGINCEAKLSTTKDSVSTEYLPVFKQLRMKTNPTIRARFDELTGLKAIPVLKTITNAMKQYLSKYEDQEREFHFTSIGKQKFEEDLRQFKEEIARFEYGITILEKYPLVLDAFRSMNLTFAKAGQSKATEKKYEAWRIFQIIFIVMNLPDVVSTEYRDVNSKFEQVEVIYFPTGGGKTETYLGLSIFTLFFDRLRGKKFGVSIMTKFPLRLLSLQQIQRIANVLAQAELIRRTHPSINGLDVEGFSLGYYVGDANTPNKLIDNKAKFGGEDVNKLNPIIEDVQRIKKGEKKYDDESLESRKYLILSKCPFCGSKKILIDADVGKIRLLHRCMDCEEDILPIFISDVEIYRYLPSFIISTLDKIAICGWQKNFRNLFGQVTHKCPMHGYSSTSECTEKYSCKVDKNTFTTVIPYDPVPTLQIQDEMHLVRESLGTFNAHYESFLEQFERMLTKGKRSMKIIAATATISDFRMQTNHLYCKQAVQYPSQGPFLFESFYSSVDKEDLNRIVIGIMPHNMTQIFSMVTILKTYHSIINDYTNNPMKLIDEAHLEISQEDAKELLELYKIKLSYHLAKKAGDSIASSLRTMTNPNLRAQGIPEIKQKLLTGDVTFNDVRVVLDQLENPHGTGDDIDLVIATSMISHGVDIDKLNFIVFMGMPHNTAEYIQASSRVGRANPGIVVVLLNPTRERDQSYFKFFTKFHEYRDLLIEAVPINRWAKFSILRTLPGIFTAAVFNYFDIGVVAAGGRSITTPQSFKKAIDTGLITEDSIREFLLKSYKVDKDPFGFGFSSVIAEKTETFVHQITQSLDNKFIINPMTEKPMNSLRDVDQQIEIGLASTDDVMLQRHIKSARTLAYDTDEEFEPEQPK